jgi:hypothetical protein
LLLATDKTGAMDYSRMSDEIDVLIASGPNGIYSNGTATGIQEGAHGAYSNVACTNPFVAQKWFEMISTDMPAVLEL